MRLREITGTFLDIFGEPASGKTVTFMLTDGDFTSSEQVQTFRKDVILTESGAIPSGTEIWANDDGYGKEPIVCYPPDGKKFEFVMPYGDGSAISINQLRLLGFTVNDDPVLEDYLTANYLGFTFEQTLTVDQKTQALENLGIDDDFILSAEILYDTNAEDFDDGDTILDFADKTFTKFAELYPSGDGTQFWANDGTFKEIDLSDFATETYVNNAINGLLDAAPAALDTLNELAAALGDDANFASTVTTSLAGKANLTLSNISSQSAARTSLGLGTMATETAANYALLAGATFTGNVGIGMTPLVGNGTLQVYNSAVGQAIYAKGQGGSGTPTLIVDDTSNNTGLGIYANSLAKGRLFFQGAMLLDAVSAATDFYFRATGALYFVTGAVANPNAMSINTSGNVAIGSHTATSKLHVRNASGNQLTLDFDAANKLDVLVNSSGVANFTANSFEIGNGTQRLILSPSTGTLLYYNANNSIQALAASVLIMAAGVNYNFDTNGIYAGTNNTRSSGVATLAWSSVYTAAVRTDDASGTDIAGRELIIAGGRPTGAGVGGNIKFQTAAAGASGTTLRSLVDRMTINQVGFVSIASNLIYLDPSNASYPTFGMGAWYMQVNAGNAFIAGNGTFYTAGVGIGTGSGITAKLQVRSTTEQLRLEYDAANYMSATVSSAGITNFATTGSYFSFSKETRIESGYFKIGTGGLYINMRYNSGLEITTSALSVRFWDNIPYMRVNDEFQLQWDINVGIRRVSAGRLAITAGYNGVTYDNSDGGLEVGTLYLKDGTIKQVTYGAADSGGAGKKVLVIDN